MSKKSTQELKLVYWEFDQNNSGGSFVENEELAHRVIIEAYSSEEACSKATEIGIYFNGCDEGMDCPCCGDRWYPPYSNIEIPYYWSSMNFERAEKIASLYDAEPVPVRDTRHIYRDNDMAVLFKSIDGYAQFLAEEYGSTSPDVIVYNYDGSVKKFYSSRIEEYKKSKKTRK
jgi:hypothetical protein